VHKSGNSINGYFSHICDPIPKDLKMGSRQLVDAFTEGVDNVSRRLAKLQRLSSQSRSYLRAVNLSTVIADVVVD
jgi:hypothetical protein